MLKKVMVIVIAGLLLLALAGCAAGPNDLVNTAPEGREVAGFWLGLWHGFITPVTFFVSLFNKNVGIYEIHNNGGWYNFGFLLGLSILSGGGSRTVKKTKYVTITPDGEKVSEKVSVE
ncbi:MAG: hypothetical protein JXA13_16600 [Anaerolineales bacterium]|nr:hypothetical protein [Anaerolineales bacterium]